MNKNHILYIEGGAADGARFTSIILEAGSGREVIVCKNGLEGKAHLEAHSRDLPAIIVSEMIMPGMDGLTFLAWLKGEARFRQIPLVFFTTAKDTKIIKTAFAAQAAGYMAKPSEAEAYQETVGVISRYWKTSFIATAHF